jgi:hypothetical protein
MTRRGSGAARRVPSRRAVLIGVAVLVVVLAAAGTVIALESSTTARSAHGLTASASTQRNGPSATTSAPARSTTSTSTTLPPPGPGFVAGQVTAVGDSVMLDYQDPLKAAIPGINVDASVSRQWSEGEDLLFDMRAGGHLGAEVVVGLGTNGPITNSDFDSMMSILGGASRVVFVNIHVDRPWQDANNAVLANGAHRYRNVVVADWATLATQNPGWFGADGTHLAIDGPGADALASLVATTLSNG